MGDLSNIQGVGTLLRLVVERLDDEVAELYRDLGLPEYRPRFSPFVRVLVVSGPVSIRDLALAIEVTHSAASQTVAQMARSGFVTLQPGDDARQRIVSLTPKARSLLSIVQAEWMATDRAIRDLETELAVPLTEVLVQTIKALELRPFRERIADASESLLTDAHDTR